MQDAARCSPRAWLTAHKEQGRAICSHREGGDHLCSIPRGAFALCLARAVAITLWPLGRTAFFGALIVFYRA